MVTHSRATRALLFGVRSGLPLTRTTKSYSRETGSLTSPGRLSMRCPRARPINDLPLLYFHISTPAARRRGNRIKLARIATVLSALVPLAAELRAQARNVPRAEDLRDLGYVDARNIGGNSVGKISSADGLGSRRCGMSPEEFANFYPPLLNWISDHIDRQRACGANRRLPRVFASTALFHRRDTGIDKSCPYRSVAHTAANFHGVNSFCRF